MWICGLLSPLSVDALVVLGHTVGAAAAAATVLLALRCRDDPRPIRIVALLAAAAPLVLVRNEGVLLLLALAGVLFVRPGRSAVAMRAAAVALGVWAIVVRVVDESASWRWARSTRQRPSRERPRASVGSSRDASTVS